MSEPAAEWIHTAHAPCLSLHEFFAAEIAHEDETQKFELVALEREGDICYAAYRIVNKTTGQEKVSALVIELVSEAMGFKYRMTTEYEGPKQYRCPRVIYDLLTRFRHCEECGPAKIWRDRVENWHRRNA
jgi:hypothetical protein